MNRRDRGQGGDIFLCYHRRWRTPVTLLIGQSLFTNHVTDRERSVYVLLPTVVVIVVSGNNRNNESSGRPLRVERGGTRKVEHGLEKDTNEVSSAFLSDLSLSRCR